MARILTVSAERAGGVPDHPRRARGGRRRRGHLDRAGRLPGGRAPGRPAAQPGRGRRAPARSRSTRRPPAAPAVACQGGEVTAAGAGAQAAATTRRCSAAGGRVTIEKCEAQRRVTRPASSSPTAPLLTATDVKVTGGQYGVVIDDSGGVVDKCEIRDITDDGIIVRLGADPTIRNSTVAGCGFRGVYVYQAGRPTIERCDISGTGDAGISVAHQSAPTIVDSWVHDTRGRRHHVRPRLRRPGRAAPGSRTPPRPASTSRRAPPRRSTPADEGDRLPKVRDQRDRGRHPAGHREGRQAARRARLDDRPGRRQGRGAGADRRDPGQRVAAQRRPGRRRGQPPPGLHRRARHRQDHRRPPLRPAAQGARRAAERPVPGGVPARPGRPVHRAHRGEDHRRSSSRRSAGCCSSTRRTRCPGPAAPAPTSARRPSTRWSS